MNPKMRQVVFCIACVLVALPALVTLVDAFRIFGLAFPSWFRVTASIVALVLGLPAAIVVFSEVQGVMRSFERLRGFIVMMQADEADMIPRFVADELPPESRRLFDAVESLLGGRLAEQALPVKQLESVLSALPDAIVVINHSGQVSLVNGPAQALLGADAVTVGTSIYDALSPTGIEIGLDRAAAAGGAVETTLPTVHGLQLPARVVSVHEGRGAILVFHATDIAASREMDHDLALLDVPPEPQPLTDDTPLADLPIFVFDLETTGLDVERDSIVAIGGLRMHGATIYRGATIDRLVNPGRPIPAHSTAVHGITDEMVTGASEFRDVWPELQPLLAGTVLVGHNVGFDIAHLDKATREAGIEWHPQPYLCTYLLAGAMELTAQPAALDVLAREFGVRVRGRHTALGDSLVTAEVFSRLMQRLFDHGIETLGEAVAFAQRRADLLRQHRDLGWWTGQDH